MFEMIVHTAPTTSSDSSRCSGRVVPIVHSPYYGYGFVVKKFNVIGGSYDLWRRPS